MGSRCQQLAHKVQIRVVYPLDAVRVIDQRVHVATEEEENQLRKAPNSILSMRHRTQRNDMRSPKGETYCEEDEDAVADCIRHDERTVVGAHWSRDIVHGRIQNYRGNAANAER